MSLPGRPIDRAPPALRTVVDETRAAHEQAPSDATWDAYLAAVRACIDWCDEQRRNGVAA